MVTRPSKPQETQVRLRVPVTAACAVIVALGFATSGMAASPNKTVVVYDDFSSGTNAKWSNPYGPLEMA